VKFLKRLSASEIFQDLRHLNSLNNKSVSVSKNVCEIPLFPCYFSFLKNVPHSLSLDRFLFCCCDDSTGLARCLQDFANVFSIANVFAMFAKMFVWFRNLFLRSWVAAFV
jgi:hypothetical protein